MRGAYLVMAIGSLAVLPACGGSSFTAAGPGDGGGATDSATQGGDTGAPSEGGLVDVAPGEGGQVDGGPGEAGSIEAGPVGTFCGAGPVCTGTGGQQGTVCCVVNGNPPSYACAGAECGCATQLDCSSDTDCTGSLRCCIANRTDVACTAGHFVARCQATCPTGERHMCTPGAAAGTCLGPCSSDTTNVGLPAGAGFGVCN